MPAPEIENALAEAMRDCQAGRLDAALARYRQALTAWPDSAEVHNAYGNLLSGFGEFAGAAQSYRQAITLNPRYAEAHNNLGNALFDQGRQEEALACYHQALTLKPGFAGAHNNLGTAQLEQGKLQEAEASFRAALALAPDFAGARANLGNALFDQGKIEGAIACYRDALRQNPDDVEAYGNLGIALWEQGALDEAQSVYRRILEIRPDDIATLNNLAALLMVQGEPVAALELVEQSLAAGETARARRLFVEIINRLPLTQGNGAILVRALDEAWVRATRVAPVSAALIKLDSNNGGCVARAEQAWPRRLAAAELFGAKGVAALAEDKLLIALLCAAPNIDVGLERLLTMARSLLLDAALAQSSDESGLAFHAALARQCFINEYVFAYGDVEITRAADLRGKLAVALQSGGKIPLSWILAVACYVPLHSVPGAAALLNRAWPEAVAAVVTQQVREPLLEDKLSAAIARLTRIEDAVSKLVQDQYEENPYPRWVKAPAAEAPVSVAAYLGRKFPLSHFKRDGLGSEILVAGCGTGQHSIKTARRYRNAKVLAVDLSRSALAYAIRKTDELSVAGIVYGQGDILELGSLGRHFDVIESVGTLHHMADPWAGWKTLVSLLRPGGVMEIALYSDVARRNIVKARAFIAEHGYQPTPEGIRQCRQELLERGKSEDFAVTVTCEDFFSTSTCRDMIFHVQEHRTSLPVIAAFLHDNGLDFLGFEVESHVLHDYRRRFPGDPAATDLAQWQIFENDNPEIFFPMYQFWVQKPG